MMKLVILAFFPSIGLANLLDGDYSSARILASMKLNEGDPPAALADALNQLNVARISRVLAQERFAYLFPEANEARGPTVEPLTHENFLKAAWKFPKLCGEESQTDDMCKEELACMFAHFVQETGSHVQGIEDYRTGLYWSREVGCTNYKDLNQGHCSQYCASHGMFGEAYKCYGSYFGRGPKQLSWNYNYAMFGKAMHRNESVYLCDPEKVLDGYIPFAATLWFYMTPQIPKPSIHEICSGLWRPNARDASAGICHGFGATTRVINGGLECGGSAESIQSSRRMGYYRKFVEILGANGLPVDCDGCTDMHDFPAGGTAGDQPKLYLYPAYGDEHCEPVIYQTPWFVGMDEKECICHQRKKKGMSVPDDCPIQFHCTAPVRKGTPPASTSSSGSGNGGSAWGSGSDTETRCGSGWFDATKKCGDICLTDDQCSNGERCYGAVNSGPCDKNDDSLPTEKTNPDSSSSDVTEKTTTDSPPSNSSDTVSRCGITWLDARSKCGEKCSSNGECGDGKECFADVNAGPCPDDSSSTSINTTEKSITDSPHTDGDVHLPDHDPLSSNTNSSNILGCECRVGSACYMGYCNNCRYLANNIAYCYIGWSTSNCVGHNYKWCGAGAVHSSQPTSLDTTTEKATEVTDSTINPDTETHPDSSNGDVDISEATTPVAITTSPVVHPSSPSPCRCTEGVDCGSSANDICSNCHLTETKTKRTYCFNGWGKFQCETANTAKTADVLLYRWCGERSVNTDEGNESEIAGENSNEERTTPVTDCSCNLGAGCQGGKCANCRETVPNDPGRAYCHTSWTQSTCNQDNYTWCGSSA